MDVSPAISGRPTNTTAFLKESYCVVIVSQLRSVSPANPPSIQVSNTPCLVTRFVTSVLVPTCSVQKVGLEVGWKVGLTVGAEVGLNVGEDVGFAVGLNVGENVGLHVGEAVGAAVGTEVGWRVGLNVGADVGRAEG